MVDGLFSVDCPSVDMTRSGLALAFGNRCSPIPSGTYPTRMANEVSRVLHHKSPLITQ